MTDIVIKQPKFKQGIGTHYADWDEFGISVELSRFKDNAHCEIMVIHSNGEGREILLQPTNCNLLSSRDLSGLAKKLHDRTPELTDKNWDTMLGYVSYLSMKTSREGEPVVLLDDTYGKHPPEFIVEPLIVKNLPNLFYAEKGSAKSQFISALALSLESKSIQDNPLKLNISNRESKALYLDWEQDSNTVGWITACLRRGLGLPDTFLHYRHCSMTLAEDLPQIQNKIEETNANVVIIDSLGLAVGGDLNLTEPALKFYGALRHIPVTPIIIAQTSKDINNKRKTVYGNALYEYLARNIWEINKQQDKGSNIAVLTLYHRKPPPFKGYSEPMGFRFTFSYDNTVIEPTEANGDKAEDFKGLSDTDVVLSILDTENRPLTPKEITDLTEPKLSNGNVRQALMRLKNNSKILRNEDGSYLIK